MDALAQFREAIARAGLPVPDTVTADGALHRFSTNGKAHDASGWYVLHLTGIPSGAFGCWRLGLTETWCAFERAQMSDDEYHELIRRMEQAKQQREADREQQHLAAAGTAARLWEAAEPAPATHPYLVRKQVQPHGIRSDGDTLMIPMYDGAGQLCSLQFIDGAGEKLFMPGGRVAGCYYAINGDRTTVYVAEGFATAASIAEASGAAVAVCFTAGQILAVAQLMRGKLPAARLVVAADNDVRGDDSENTGLKKATDAATVTEALLAVPELDGAKCDFNDVHVARGLDDVRQQLARAALTEQTLMGRELRRLLELGPIQYDKERRAVAKKLGVRAGVIDKQIESLRQQTAESKERQAVEALFTPIEPYDGEVNGRELVIGIRREIQRYVVLSEHEAFAAALWTLHTHAVKAAYITPILSVRSSQKRSGKSSLLDVLRSLVYRGLMVNSVSTAVVYRAMDLYRPTLLIDEADAFLDENEELRGIINGGHSRATARTLRIGGPNRDKVEVFDSFGPKAIAGIGKRRDTIADRAIEINLRRRKTDEPVESLRQDRLSNSNLQLQRFCAAWATTNLVELGRADPVVPKSLHDRAADNWRPLLAIADLCAVGTEARASAIALTGQDDSESAGVLLLEDLCRLFAKRKTDRLSSSDIVEVLGAMEERPWSEWRAGKAITPRQLARLLEPFGVAPRTVRFGEGTPTSYTAKGYTAGQFDDVFPRYLPKSTPSSVTASQPLENSGLADTQSVTEPATVTDGSVTEPTDVTDRKSENPNGGAACYGVTDKNAEKQGAEKGIRCRDCMYYDPDGPPASYCLKFNQHTDPDKVHFCPDFRVPT